MEPSTVFIKFLQACITPVAMISGVGLLLLTVTNRMGRTVDRIRQLITELDKPDTKRRKEKEQEIGIFLKRSKLLRNSIAWIMVGMISSCMMIPVVFVMSVNSIDLRIFGYMLFIAAVISMMNCFIYFFRDVLISLHAIKLEANEYIK